MNCSICKKEITKRNSYALSDGTRACKTHDLTGRLPKKDFIPPPPKTERVRNFKQFRDPLDLRPHCFHCDKPGTFKEIIASRFLVNMQKYKLIHGETPNPFSSDFGEVVNMVKTDLGLSLEEIMVQLKRYDISYLKDWQINQLILYKYQPVIQLSGNIASICDECASEFELKQPEMPKLDTKEMLTLGAIGEMVYSEVAQKELDQENLNDHM